MVAHHHHQEFISMASRMIDEAEPQDRQYNTLVFTASRDTFEAVKERIQGFQEELRELFARDKHEDGVYTLAMQLFPNTQRTDPKVAPSRAAIPLKKVGTALTESSSKTSNSSGR